MPNVPDLAPVPDIRDIKAAGDRLAGNAVRTPLITNPVLNRVTGGRVFLKAEPLQKTGSFKFRGAFNRLAQIPDADRAKGVVACSSGNHAQGVAEAARMMGIDATIVMPADAPLSKRQRTERSGATVIDYDREADDREAIARDLCARTGATFVHPYNDPAVIAGQGTCGLEICEALEAAGSAPDAVLVCCGGGGLTAGVTLAVKHAFPDCACYCVEPEDFDDTTRSLESGQRETNARSGGSVCDAVLAPQPGPLSFAINRQTLEGGLVVSDQEALDAVAFAFRELKIVVEPGGAVALAALLARKIDVTDKTVAAVLSGGNIDDSMMKRALA